MLRARTRTELIHNYGMKMNNARIIIAYKIIRNGNSRVEFLSLHEGLKLVLNSKLQVWSRSSLRKIWTWILVTWSTAADSILNLCSGGGGSYGIEPFLTIVFEVIFGKVS